MFQAPEPPTVDAVRDAIRPALTKHFKPALLARMTVVPYVPIGREILKDIAALKLNSLAGRLHTSHRIKTEFAPEVWRSSPAVARTRTRAPATWTTSCAPR